MTTALTGAARMIPPRADHSGLCWPNRPFPASSQHAIAPPTTVDAIMDDAGTTALKAARRLAPS